MENNTLSYREIGGWLLVIFFIGVLNASSDVVILLSMLAKAYGVNRNCIKSAIHHQRRWF